MRRDRGAAAVEYAAMFPLATLLILFLFEALMTSLSVERVENAVRTGARTASQNHAVGACVPAAHAAMPGWLNDKVVTAAATDGGVKCSVQADVPLLWPGVPFEFTVQRSVTMPMG
ncbi:TadE/TadG family type IV pilus assembly protein [Actinocorallia libanotica]|uniref:TadE-like domain-containing protein n=1 Tax=Actinocorallia libanotica TaxID=46162 RepID=A0ABP4CF02_9ACTN